MDEQVQPRGLSAAECRGAGCRGEVNGCRRAHAPVRQIVRENTLTLFNAINVILAVFVLVTGSYKNMLFHGGHRVQHGYRHRAGDSLEAHH